MASQITGICSSERFRLRYNTTIELSLLLIVTPCSRSLPRLFRLMIEHLPLPHYSQQVMALGSVSTWFCAIALLFHNLLTAFFRS